MPDEDFSFQSSLLIICVSILLRNGSNYDTNATLLRTTLENTKYLLNFSKSFSSSDGNILLYNLSKYLDNVQIADNIHSSSNLIPVCVNSIVCFL